MSTANSLSNKMAENENKTVEYLCNGETVKLSQSIIRKFLVSGGGEVSNQELVMFLNLCRFQHLNPFLREAYLVKYGSSPATIVVGKEVFTKRAKRNKDYRGMEAGIIVVTAEKTIEERVGTFSMEGETLVGGWAKVYIQDFEIPQKITVSLEEYIGRKSNGEVNSQWAKKPATMIRKVAIVQALRESFPEDLQGLYSQEEFAETSDVELDANAVDQDAIEAKPTAIHTETIPFPTKEIPPATQEADPLA